MADVCFFRDRVVLSLSSESSSLSSKLAAEAMDLFELSDADAAAKEPVKVQF